MSHRRKQVTVVERAGASWTMLDVRAGELVSIESLALSLAVDELYSDIELAG